MQKKAPRTCRQAIRFSFDCVSALSAFSRVLSEKLAGSEEEPSSLSWNVWSVSAIAVELMANSNQVT